MFHGGGGHGGGGHHGGGGGFRGGFRGGGWGGFYPYPYWDTPDYDETTVYSVVDLGTGEVDPGVMPVVVTRSRRPPWSVVG